MQNSPLKLNLRGELKKKLETRIMDNITEAVRDHQDRDELLREYDDQLQGLTGWTGKKPWKDACELDDPITRDQFLTYHSMLWAALARDPKMLVEAAFPDDEKAAEDFEPYMTHKMYEAGYNAVLPDLIYNLLRWPVAILYCGHIERVADTRFTGYVPADAPNTPPVEEQFKLQGVEYDAVPMMRPGEVVYKGLDLRSIDTTDFYQWPVQSKDLQTANGCGIRLLWTADDLLAGIDNWGLDEKIVYEMIQKPPPGTQEDGSDYRSLRDQRDGLGSNVDAGFYEVFVWYTKMPLLFEDGELRTPKYLLGDDFLTISCPTYGSMLRMDFSPSGRTRPFVPYYMFKKPDCFYGECLPIWLEAIQSEANANIRHGINCMNFNITPSWKVYEPQMKKYENFRNFPGAIFPYSQKPEEIEVMYTPDQSGHSFELAQMLRNWAGQLTSGGGFNQLQTKVRKAAEVQAAQHAAFTKFDDILAYVQQGVELTWRQAASILANHMDDDGEDFLDQADHKRTVTPQTLKKYFIFRPVASSQNTDPETRIAYNEKRTQVVDTWLAMLANPQIPLPIKKMRWHLTRQSLIDLHTHNIEALIGVEPSEASQMLPQQPPQTPPVGAPTNGATPYGGNGTGVPMALPMGNA